MAMQRLRWTNTGAELIRTTARDGAMVRHMGEPRRPGNATFMAICRPPGRMTQLHSAALGASPSPDRDCGIKLTGRGRARQEMGSDNLGPGESAGYETHDPDAFTTSP